MIKPHCPICSHIFTGPACFCRQGRPPRPLKCECGRPAAEIYQDDLGEWPLCARCLELEQDGFAPMPLSGRSAEDDPYLFNERIPLSIPAGQGGESDGFPPCGLTDREYEIAQLAHLPNAEIAFLSKISPSTVKSYFSRILKKLGVHSRYEIPYCLRVQSTAELPNGPEVAPSSPAEAGHAIGASPITLTLTVTANPAQLEGLLAWLDACRNLPQ